MLMSGTWHTINSPAKHNSCLSQAQQWITEAWIFVTASLFQNWTLYTLYIICIFNSLDDQLWFRNFIYTIVIKNSHVSFLLNGISLLVISVKCCFSSGMVGENRQKCFLTENKSLKSFKNFYKYLAFWWVTFVSFVDPTRTQTRLFLSSLIWNNRA